MTKNKDEQIKKSRALSFQSLGKTKTQHREGVCKGLSSNMSKLLLLPLLFGSLVVPSAACDRYFTPEFYPIGRGWQPYLVSKEEGSWLKVLPPKGDRHRSIVFTLYNILEKYNENPDVFRRANVTAPLYMKLDLKCDNLDRKSFLMRESGVSDNPYTGFKNKLATWKRVKTYDTNTWPEVMSFMGCMTISSMEMENTIFYDDDTYYSKKYGRYTWEPDKCGRVKL